MQNQRMANIIPTIIVHGGAGIYATIVHDQASKKDIEDGIHTLLCPYIKLCHCWIAYFLWVMSRLCSDRLLTLPNCNSLVDPQLIIF
jgi:hypothetical protein